MQGRAKRLAPFAIAMLITTLPARASDFVDCLGWTEDVDLVAAPDREFLVVPEQASSGAARVRLMNLDPATGQFLGVGSTLAVPGFEVGVDPIVVPELGPGLGRCVLVPVESPNGAEAGLLVLRANANGLAIFTRFIDLDDLGFAADVDGTWNFYAGPAVAYFPLESEDGSVRGILAVDVDPRPGMGAAGAGACTLLSTDNRPLGDLNFPAPWLPGLTLGVDPVAYEIIACCSRLALPVDGAGGADLLLVDFDPNVPGPPMYLTYQSVKDVNEGTARPTDFPGWEWDVDLRHYDVGCGAGGPNALLVPVEGGGEGDIYLLDQDGNSVWVLSIDGQAGGLDVPGFEKGVDMLPICGMGGPNPNLLLLAIENATGTDADVWFVDLATGDLITTAETANAGLTIEGFEIGVDPFRWTINHLAVPVEGTDGVGRLLLFDSGGAMIDLTDFPLLPGDWGYIRSVDPVAVWPYSNANPRLYVPLARVDDPEQTDLLFYSTPGSFAGAQSLEAINDFFDLELGEMVTDLDPGMDYPVSAGSRWVALAETATAGFGPRLRFEFVPVTAAEPVLVLATDESAAVPAALRMFYGNWGGLVAEFEDVQGLAAGLDLACGRGPLTANNPPNDALVAGYDADTDPTLIDVVISTGVEIPGDMGSAGSGPTLLARLRHANPLSPPVAIRLALSREASLSVEVIDPAGRLVRRLHSGPCPAGEMSLAWDGRDEQGQRAGAGVYFITAAGEGVRTASKVVLLR